jgi:prepilin signal peptidase PulO-like enzyme (type II secretory pathway)
MIFLASLIGSAVIAPALAAKNKSMASKLPYGPFLIIAAGILVIYGDSIINWYKGFLV